MIRYPVLTPNPTFTNPNIGAATYTSLYGTSTPSINGNYVTAYPSKFAQYYNGTAASATLPELASYVELHSTVGYANRASAYKIASGGLVIDDSVSAGHSADLYGLNYVVQGFGGAGGNLLVGCEVDVNNVGLDAISLGANTSVYGFVAPIGGTGRGTAAYWAPGLPSAAGWNYGFAVSNVIGFSGFYDTSNSPIVLCAVGTHTTGVDFTSATLTTAFASNGFTVTGTGSVTMSGTLQLGSTYAAGAPAATGYITMKDHTGTTYKFLVST
jgi:hypothetical protein